ncbi:MAG TPA: PilZ domain-containing protein [Pseudomonadales bacterium]|nr:PilZ domain-containing protein [Pseudomonadales bacterium]
MSSEKRSENRIRREEQLYVEIMASSYDESLPGAVVACTTCDISPNGLQVKMDQPVQAGAILDLCIEMQRSSKRFFLTGEVKWVRENEDGLSWRVGFLLFDGINTDIEEWKALF